MRGKKGSGSGGSGGSGGGKRRMKGGNGSGSIGGISDISSMSGVSGVSGISGISSMSGINSKSISDWFNKMLDNLKKVIKVYSYKFLFSMLLVISCIYLVFATIIFVNACINLHKTSFVYPTEDTTKYRKLIDAPIFEYLKTKNFLAVDKFLLNANNSLKPSSVAFWTVTGIMLGTVIFLAIHYKMLSDKEEIIEYNNGLKKNIWYVGMASLPYILIFIIAIWFNTIQVNNNNDLNRLIITSDKQYKKQELQEIKKKLQKILYSNEALDATAIVEKFAANEYIKPVDKSAVSTTVSAAVITTPVPANTSVGNTSVAIDLEAIVYIYKHNLVALNLLGDELKQYQRKYINYIDEYFELLGSSGSSGSSGSGDDYYTKFFLYGLIEYKDGDEAAFGGRSIMYRVNIKNDGGGLEKLLITTITSNIRAYFIGVISFYTLCALGVIILLIYLNDAAKKPLIHLGFILYKIANIEILPIIIAVIAMIALVIGVLFFVIPLIYNWIITVPSWMLYS